MTQLLLALQQIDLTIDRLSSRRAALEQGDDVRAARERLGLDERRLGEVVLALEELDRAYGKLEFDADSLGRKAADEEKRALGGNVVNSKELEAIQAEVRNVRDRQRRAEDEMLELLERREILEAQADELRPRVDAQKADVESLGGDAAREITDIAAELDAREIERKSAVESIGDAELIELYEDLRARKRGVGAATLVDRACQGCHETLSALELDKLKKSDDVRRCPHCRRILVF